MILVILYLTQIKDTKPQFTPINKYKPTGNLVYNPDILEKIEKKSIIFVEFIYLDLR